MALTGSGEYINKQVQAENERLKKLIGELIRVRKLELKEAFP